MERLISGIGLLAMIGFAYLLSSNRKAFPLRVVVGGLILQIVFALLILWTPPGKSGFWYGRRYLYKFDLLRG